MLFLAFIFCLMAIPYFQRYVEMTGSVDPRKEKALPLFGMGCFLICVAGILQTMSFWL